MYLQKSAFLPAARGKTVVFILAPLHRADDSRGARGYQLRMPGTYSSGTTADYPIHKFDIIIGAQDIRHFIGVRHDPIPSTFDSCARAAVPRTVNTARTVVERVVGRFAPTSETDPLLEMR